MFDARESTSADPGTLGARAGSAVACLGLALGLVGCEPKGRGPLMVIEKAEVALGLLEPGQHDATVEVANRGNAPLHVLGVRSSCACTVPEHPATIAAGDSAPIRCRVTASPGAGSATLAIDSDDPGGSRSVRLTWSGRCVPTLVEPRIDLTVRAGRAIDREFEVSYSGGTPPTPVQLVGATGLPPGFSVESVSTNPAVVQADPHLSRIDVLGKAILRLRGRAPAARGESDFRGVIEVRQGEASYRLPIDVRLKVHDGLRPTPERLLFSATTFEGLARQRRTAIILMDDGDGRLEIARKPDYLDASIDRAGRAGVATLEVRISTPPPEGSTRAEIEVADARGGRSTIPVLISFDP